MNRTNIFHYIHKGLRAMLYDMALTIQRTDFIREEEAKATLRKLKRVLDLYSLHARYEGEAIFPAVAQASPETVTMLKAGHEKGEQLINDMLLQVRQFRNAGSRHERESVGYVMHLAFQEFVAFNLQLMCNEEKMINPLLWANYTDEEIEQITERMLNGISAEDGAQYARWMLKGLNDAEIVAWIKKVQQAAPTQVWKGLQFIAMDELGYDRVSALLSGRVATAF